MTDAMLVLLFRLAVNREDQPGRGVSFHYYLNGRLEVAGGFDSARRLSHA